MGKVMTDFLADFLFSANTLYKIPGTPKYAKQSAPGYPFDVLALSLSPLYRQSRRLYLLAGGKFSPNVCSVARSLSDEDLFRKEIEYSPIEKELRWFSFEGYFEVASADESARNILDMGGISLFHEQNHRILWELLPPPPEDKIDFLRYLNFAESLVVGLDLALADEFGRKTSTALEHMKTIYRTGGRDSWYKKAPDQYRKYLSAAVLSTYLRLEGYDPRDLAKGLNVIFPNDKGLVKAAVKRSLDLSGHFVSYTNPAWQDRHWQFALKTLTQLNRKFQQDPLCMPEDPLEIAVEELDVIGRVFRKFSL
jgi:hypothetical protein